MYICNYRTTAPDGLANLLWWATHAQVVAYTGYDCASCRVCMRKLSRMLHALSRCACMPCIALVVALCMHALCIHALHALCLHALCMHALCRVTCVALVVVLCMHTLCMRKLSRAQVVAYMYTGYDYLYGYVGRRHHPYKKLMLQPCLQGLFHNLVTTFQHIVINLFLKHATTLL